MTRQIQVGNVVIGGGAPVVIQSIRVDTLGEDYPAPEKK